MGIFCLEIQPKLNNLYRIVFRGVYKHFPIVFVAVTPFFNFTFHNCTKNASLEN